MRVCILIKVFLAAKQVKVRSHGNNINLCLRISVQKYARTAADKLQKKIKNKTATDDLGTHSSVSPKCAARKQEAKTEQSAQKQKATGSIRSLKTLTIFLCFALWGREAASRLGLAQRGSKNKQSAAEPSSATTHKGSRCQFWTGSLQLLCKKEVRDTFDWAQTPQQARSAESDGHAKTNAANT